MDAGRVLGAVMVALCLVSCGPLRTLFSLPPRFAPAPPAYPGAAATPDHTTTVCNHIRMDSTSYDYTVPVPVEEVEAYFAEEMAHYCEPGALFEDSILLYGRCDDGTPCRFAECIPSATELQLVHIYLKPISESETRVMQMHHVQSPSRLDPVFCGE